MARLAAVRNASIPPAQLALRLAGATALFLSGCAPQQPDVAHDATKERVQAEAPKQSRPEPGSMTAYPPIPLPAALPKWGPIWAWAIDKETLVGGHIEPWGYESGDADHRDWRLRAEGIDNFVAFFFDSRALKAETCSWFRLSAQAGDHAGIWWARNQDLQSSEYAFSPERFQLMRPVEPGTFEINLTHHPNWNGDVRLIRIDLFTAPGETVALSELNAELSKGLSWTETAQGIKALTRETPQLAQDRLVRFEVTRSLAALEALADLWYAAPETATESGRTTLKTLGTEMGCARAEAGDIAEALRAFSAAARGCGTPVEYLYELRHDIPEPIGDKLWPDGPYVVLEDFERTEAPRFVPWVVEQGRNVIRNARDTEVSRVGSASAVIEVSAPAQDGRSWFALPAYVPLSEKPFGLRLWLKRTAAATAGVAVQCWFPHEQKATLVQETQGIDSGDGWVRYEVYQDFLAYANKEQYDTRGSHVLRIGLMIDGPAATFWLNRIELFLRRTGDDAASRRAHPS